MRASSPLQKVVYLLLAYRQVPALDVAFAKERIHHTEAARDLQERLFLMIREFQSSFESNPRFRAFID